MMQNVLDSLTNKYPDLISSPDKYRFKIIFSEIDRKGEEISLETVGFRANSKEYLYPASIVKLPTALIALEQYNNLSKQFPLISMNSSIKFVKDKGCLPTMNQVKIGNRMMNASLDVLFKQMFAVSDNDAYNRVFDFCGQQILNQRLKQLNFSNGKIIRKFVLNCSLDQNRISDSMVFLGKRSERLFTRPTLVNLDTIKIDTTFKLGLAYEGFDKKVVTKPFDFSRQNNLDLLDIHKTLQGLMFPKSKEAHHFSITPEQRKYVLSNLGKYPDEYGLSYNALEFFPTYKKYLFFGRDPKLNYLSDTLQRFRSFNIVGVSFGCVIDAAYLVDFKTGKECLLTVGIYANKDEVINDGKYDYDTFAYPLMKDIGRYFMQQISENQESVGYLKQFALDLDLK